MIPITYCLISWIKLCYEVECLTLANQVVTSPEIVTVVDKLKCYAHFVLCSSASIVVKQNGIVVLDMCMR